MPSRAAIAHLAAVLAACALCASCSSGAGGDEAIAKLASPATGTATDTVVATGIAFDAANFDVCSLLTPGEASAFAGETLRTPEADRNRGGQVVCTFGAAEFMSYAHVQIAYIGNWPEPASNGYDARQVFEDARANTGPREDIAGLGDAAYRHGNTIEVLAGRVTFGVKLVTGAGSAQAPPAGVLEQLARTVLVRLQAAGAT